MAKKTTPERAVNPAPINPRMPMNLSQGEACLRWISVVSVSVPPEIRGFSGTARVSGL